MSRGVEAAWPGLDGADVSRRRRPVGLQRTLKRPLVDALPWRGPGRMRPDRRRRWTALGGGAFGVADEPIEVA
jgi:hypothetical protein